MHLHVIISPSAKLLQWTLPHARRLGEEEAGPAVEGPCALSAWIFPPELLWGADTRSGRRKPFMKKFWAGKVFPSVSCKVGVIFLTFVFRLPQVLRWGEGMVYSPCGPPGRVASIISWNSLPWCGIFVDRCKTAPHATRQQETTSDWSTHPILASKQDYIKLNK